MTSWRIGLGPVFAYERIAASRRWQRYALRSLFLLALLLAVILVWERAGRGRVGWSQSYYSELARVIFLGVTGTQFALVLLAAPAATASAICLDRSRGALTHLLLTDLSDAELVLGKLAARMLPVFALLFCTLPLMEILTLAGGVDPEALLSGLFLATCLTILGCSIAMFLSLMFKKTHEALLLTYAFFVAWLVSWQVCEVIALSTGSFWLMPSLKINPLYMALAPYWHPGDVTLGDYLIFAAATGSVSSLFVWLTVLKLRSVCTRERVNRFRRQRSTVNRGSLWRFLHRNLPWVTPSLDGNPVVWREWHRGQPSRWRRVLIWLYIIMATIFSALAMIWPKQGFGPLVNGTQAAVGLLFLGVWSTTSLSEERARGGVDLLMCSPLSTWQIVTGKWLGAFRAAPLLAILPCCVIASNAYIVDRSVLEALCLMLGYLLSAGALVVSLGILMATWFSRPGPALSATVAVYVLLTVGWFFVVLSQNNGHDSDGIAMASPFFCVGKITYDFGIPSGRPLTDWAILWSGVSLLGGMAMLFKCVFDFNRCVGRAETATEWMGWPIRRRGNYGRIKLDLATAAVTSLTPDG